MPYKDPIDAAAARRRAKQRLRAKVAALLYEAKDKPCVDCGIRLPPECMDLDHVRGVKEFRLGRWNHHVNTIAAVAAEVAKCDVRCPNCHRLRHFREGDSRGRHTISP